MFNGLYTRIQARGTALIVAMAIVLLLAGLATTLLFEMQTRSDRSEADVEDIKSFEAAEAGVDAALHSINTGGNGCLGFGWNGDLNGDGFPQSNEVSTGGWYCNAPSQWSSNAGLDGVTFSATGYINPPGKATKDSPYPRPQPQEFNFYTYAVRMGDIRYYTFAVPWKKDGIDNDNNGVIDGTSTNDPNEQDWYTIYSTGFSDEYLSRLSRNPNNPIGRFTTVEVIAKQLSSDSKFQVEAALTLMAKPFSQANP